MRQIVINIYWLSKKQDEPQKLKPAPIGWETPLHKKTIGLPTLGGVLHKKTIGLLTLGGVLHKNTIGLPQVPSMDVEPRGMRRLVTRDAPT